MRALQLFARYDSMRLETYQEWGCRGRRIRIDSIGSALALRFDDVGYFNRVYAPDPSIADRLQEIEAFYEGCPYAFQLVGPTAEAADPIDRTCQHRQWRRGQRYAWLGAHTSSLSAHAESGEFTISLPGSEERVLFCESYLRAFGAPAHRFSAAIDNMRHLFNRPELVFLMARKNGRPAGVGMLYREGKAAALCAGATLPEIRGTGCHTELLKARIRMAMEDGAEEIFSWALAGSRSQANMHRVGLRTTGITHAWQSNLDRGSPSF
jgi:acetyltransferase (GNAT) family protein